MHRKSVNYLVDLIAFVVKDSDLLRLKIRKEDIDANKINNRLVLTVRTPECLQYVLTIRDL